MFLCILGFAWFLCSPVPDRWLWRRRTWSGDRLHQRQTFCSRTDRRIAWEDSRTSQNTQVMSGHLSHLEYDNLSRDMHDYFCLALRNSLDFGGCLCFGKLCYWSAFDVFKTQWYFKILTSKGSHPPVIWKNIKFCKFHHKYWGISFTFQVTGYVSKLVSNLIVFAWLWKIWGCWLQSKCLTL